MLLIFLIFSYFALILVALGSGGIKPCVSAFGGEQFKLPEQLDGLDRFYSMFYGVINFGSFLATLLSPVLRSQSCFGEKDYYSLGFFVPAILMGFSIIVFFIGTKYYKFVPSHGNVIIETVKTIKVNCKLNKKLLRINVNNLN